MVELVKRAKEEGGVGRQLLFPSLLIHLAISTQAEHGESCNDKEASNNGSRWQRLTFYAPVHKGDDEDG